MRGNPEQKKTRGEESTLKKMSVWDKSTKKKNRSMDPL